MASLDDEYSWEPPSEAELKVIEARRERNNKISSLMGQYLLKGYKMLATCCPICGCVLLEDRSNNKYCIGCCEVDADTRKDNPAVSEEAARKAVEEIQHRPRQDKEVSPLRRTEAIRENPQSKSSVSNSVLVPTSCIATSTTEPVQSIRSSRECNSLTIHGIDLSGDAVAVMNTLRDKLVWAGNQLKATNSVHEARNLAELISECCRAISTLRDL